jgi:hypothetical protein
MISETTGFTVSSFERAKRITAYEQPSEELLEAISHVYAAEDRDVQATLPKDVVGTNVVVVDAVPFFPYWQGEEGEYIFHPMDYGLFLSRLPCEYVQEYLTAALRIAHPLPNGGLLWYYPDNYRLNRFLGPDLSPSAISQGYILGAITALDRRCGLDLRVPARQAFLGLAFDYYDGGLNLEDRALLELPLFRSAPEIILNGWLHALLYLHQYADHYSDPEAQRLLDSNLQFLGEIIGSFHHEGTGLSLYSDLTPYRVTVSCEDGSVERLYAFYRARIKGMSDLVFELRHMEGETRSPYDNHIVRQTATTTELWISCSQHYDTYLVAEDGPFVVSFTCGRYSPLRATPARGGERVELASIEDGGYYVVHVTEVRDKLFCGYPTNFLKNGENYYHTYHVVALACLLATFDLPHKTRESLSSYMERWMQTVDEMSASGFTFTTYDAVLDQLVEHGACVVPDDWNVLLAMARGLGPE